MAWSKVRHVVCCGILGVSSVSIHQLGVWIRKIRPRYHRIRFGVSLTTRIDRAHSCASNGIWLYGGQLHSPRCHSAPPVLSACSSRCARGWVGSGRREAGWRQETCCGAVGSDCNPHITIYHHDHKSELYRFVWSEIRQVVSGGILGVSSVSI